jgi:hypothetical protein
VSDEVGGRGEGDGRWLSNWNAGVKVLGAR